MGEDSSKEQLSRCPCHRRQCQCDADAWQARDTHSICEGEQVECGVVDGHGCGPAQAAGCQPCIVPALAVQGADAGHPGRHKCDGAGENAPGCLQDRAFDEFGGACKV